MVRVYVRTYVRVYVRACERIWSFLKKVVPTDFFNIGYSIYFARRLKFAFVHESRLGLSVDTPVAYVRSESTKLWPINDHIFILLGQFLGHR